MLSHPAYTVPRPGPPGPIGTMAWLRATVSRFSEGDDHARRRALVETRLRALDPAVLREAAAAAARRHRSAAITGGPPTGSGAADAPLRDEPAGGVPLAYEPVAVLAAATGVAPRDVAAGGVPLAYEPVAVLAAATGVAPRDVAAAVAAVRVVAAAYHPGTDAPGADRALAALLDLLPVGEPEAVAQHVALLVQACEATAALVRGGLERPLDDVLRDAPPVPATKRVDPNGHIVKIDLRGRPFGEGPRRCPGREHALALAAGVIEGAR